jgi:Glycoside hydrolase family 44
MTYRGISIMKRSMLVFACLAMAAGASAAALASHVTVVQGTGLHDLLPGPMNGTVLPIWYSPEKVQGLVKGLGRGGFGLFRYPNGTLSNEYHWNGAGSYDSTGVWKASDSTFASGFKVNTRHRGTSRSNYGSIFPSMVVDGDSASFWWGVSEQDTIQPWLEMNLGSDAAVDSFEILWDKVRPDSVRLQGLTSGGDPLWSNSTSWDAGQSWYVTDSVTRKRLSQSVSASWFRIAALGRGVGMQIREIRLYAAGQVVSGNASGSATQVLAFGTHPANDPSGETPSRWDFEEYMKTLTREMPGFEPLLCVNVGTGTPQEAAAWVKYANKVRGFKVHRWHVGNEIDGNWEQGGPLDAGQYAARFVEFVKAMKAQDPTIEIYGPVLSTMDWKNRPSGRDSIDWMESFLTRVGDAERRDGKRYLDGVDFHAYPYYIASGNGTAGAMLKAMDKLGEQLDTLAAYMSRHLDDAGSRKVAMTEFNASVSITYLLMNASNGIGMADMLGHMAEHFGDRAVTCAWEPAGGEPMNPDGTSGSSYGSLRLFTPGKGGLTSDVGDAPTGAYWGQYLATQAWIERGRPGDGGRPVSLKATVDGNANLRAFVQKDSIRTSVMLLNLGSTGDSVTVSSGLSKDSGEVLSWSSRHYNWDGTSSLAKALPNLGPTASPWNGEKVWVPAFSAAVVRSGAAPMNPASLEMLLRTQSKSELRQGDTLVVTASVRQRGGVVRSASFAVDDATCDLSTPCGTSLASFDGAWDGSHEGAVLRLAATDLKIGKHTVRLRWAGGNGSSLTDSVMVTVTDVPRASAWIDRFDGGKKISELPTAPRWASYCASNFQSKATLTEPTWPDTSVNKRWFQLDYSISQPSAADLAYPNYAATNLSLPRKWLDTTATRWIGLTFDWNSSCDSGSTSFNLHIPEDSVTDYDDHLVSLPNTQGKWVRQELLWDAVQQSGWGKAVGPLNFATAQKLEFRANGAGRGHLSLDNLALLSTAGDALPMVGVTKQDPRRSGWNVMRRTDGLYLEAPLGSHRAKASIMDASGRVLAATQGNGLVRMDLPRAPVVWLVLISDEGREVRSLSLVR